MFNPRYLDHVKKASRSYVSQLEEEEQEVEQEECRPALQEELQEEVRHVEGRLRCIKDDHFYELLQVKPSSVPQS